MNIAGPHDDPPPLDLGWRGDPADIVDAATDPLDMLARYLRRVLPAWYADAECARPEYRNVDFMPPRGAPSLADPARAVCACCPARAQCYAMALADRTLHGVWGASTYAERERARGGRR